MMKLEGEIILFIYSLRGNSYMKLQHNLFKVGLTVNLVSGCR